MPRLAFSLWLLAGCSTLAGAGYSDGIRRASAYLVKNRQKIDARTVRTLSILSKLYTLDRDLIEVLRAAERKFPEQKENPTELEIRTHKGWRGLNMQARYCRVYPLHWDFLERLRSMSQPGWGTITRALFVMATVEWKNCERDRASFNAERDRLALAVIPVIQGEESGGELWVESVLALHFAGKGDWIGDDIVAQLLAAQAGDGSWSGNTWATARALWVLLEMQAGKLRPGTRNLPLLQSGANEN